MLPRRPQAPIVVKVGGSLFDLSDLGNRLTGWLGQLAGHRVILVPGGGPTTDVIRELDRRHRLGEECAHWLALHALTLNAHFLAALLPGAAVAECLEECPEFWRRGVVPVLDTHAFARADEGQPGCLPHSWEATSDAVAARVARVAGARKLILLKSVRIPTGASWAEATRRGFVDSGFAQAVDPALAVESVNFRDWRPPSGRA